MVSFCGERHFRVHATGSRHSTIECSVGSGEKRTKERAMNERTAHVMNYVGRPNGVDMTI